MKYLKTLLTSISSAALLLAFPIVTFAAYTAGWTGTSTGTNFIFPTLINGVYQTVQANNFLGTSTTAASNFTLLGVGSSTPFGNFGVVGTTTIKGNLLVTRTGEVPTYNDSNLSLLDIVDNVNSYTFAGLQNKNAGASASADFVWGNDRTTAATYYSDCGVTSSTYADAIFEILDPNDGYCFSTDGAFKIGAGTTTSAGYLGFFTGGYAVANEKARITQEGNLGIGTTNPLAKLQVGNGVVNSSVDSQVLISRLVDDSVSGDGHAFSDSSFITRSGGISYNSFDGRTFIGGTSDYGHYAVFQNGANYGSSGTMDIMYGFANVPTVSNGTVTNMYGVYPGDPTGAGTVINNYGVYVPQLTKGTTRNFAIFTAGNTPSSFAGKVGFGTTSPTTPLDIYGGASELQRITGTAVQGYMTFYENGTNRGYLGYGDAGLIVLNALSDSMTLRASNGLHLTASNDALKGITVTTAGNVGIGTTSPLAKFTVSNGNLEIGTTTGSTVGNITINGRRLINTFTVNNGASDQSNIFVGEDAGNYSLSSSNGQNAGFGYQVLNGLTTGVGNTIAGFRSGNAISSGSLNSGIGSSACRGVFTGSFNTCLGTNSGYFGSNNTGAHNGTASYTTSVGFGAYASRSNTMTLGGLGADYTDVVIGTSTPWARLAIQGFVGSTTPLFEIASSTNSSFATSTVFKVGYNGIITMSTTTDALTSLLNLGVNPTSTNGTTTVHLGKMQFEGYNTDGAIICTYMVGTTWVTKQTTCTN